MLTGLDGGRVVDPDARQAGGESVREMYQRAAAFCDELAATIGDGSEGARRFPAPDAAGDVVIIAHGGTVRVLTAYLHGIPPDQMIWGPVENATVVHIPDFRLPRSASAQSQCRTATPLTNDRFTNDRTANPRSTPAPSRRHPMIATALILPQRAAKPRQSGLTMVIDGGVPAGLFADQIDAGRGVHRLRQVRLGHLPGHQLPAREDQRARPPRHRLLLRRHAV